MISGSLAAPVPPNLSLDFLSAFSGYSFTGSPDPLNSNIHSFTPLEDITYLAIGTPTKNNGLLGPTLDGINSQFYISAAACVSVTTGLWHDGADGSSTETLGVASPSKGRAS